MLTNRRGEEGSVLVFVAVMAALIMGLTLLMIQGSITESKSVDLSYDSTVSTSAAEAGLEIALASLDPGDLPRSELGIGSWTPASAADWPDWGDAGLSPLTVGGGEVVTYVKANTPAVDYFTVRAVGACDLHSRQPIVTVLETIIKKQSIPITSQVTGAVAVVCGVSEEATYTDTITCAMAGSTWIDGYDYDENGNKLADQSTAVPGIAVNDGTGGVKWDITQSGNPASIYGPGPYKTLLDKKGKVVATYSVNNTAAWTGGALKQLADAAMANPDIYIPEGSTLDVKSNIGGPSDYKVVHVDVGDGNKSAWTAAAQTKGYGFLVISVDGPMDVSLIDTQGGAGWNGMILIVCGPNTTFTNKSNAGVEMRGGAGPTVDQLRGAMAFLVDPAAQLESGGVVIDNGGNPQIKYSSAAVAKAIQAVAMRNYTLTRLYGYRRIQ